MSSLTINDKYINPLTDFGFKKLFGTEMNKDLLIDFLNEILPRNKKVKELAYFKDKSVFDTAFPIQEQAEKGNWNFNLKFVYLELPKFTKKIEGLTTHCEKWLYVLRHLSDLQERPKALQARVFRKLFQAAEIANFTKEEKDAYEESLKHYRDIKNVVDTSKEEGRLEESDENVKNGIIKGYANEIISDITGRSIEDIERIREEINNKK